MDWRVHMCRHIIERQFISHRRVLSSRVNAIWIPSPLPFSPPFLDAGAILIGSKDLRLIARDWHRGVWCVWDHSPFPHYNQIGCNQHVKTTCFRPRDSSSSSSSRFVFLNWSTIGSTKPASTDDDIDRNTRYFAPTKERDEVLSTRSNVPRISSFYCLRWNLERGHSPDWWSISLWHVSALNKISPSRLSTLTLERPYSRMRGKDIIKASESDRIPSSSFLHSRLGLS